jgi:alanine racemase
LGDLNGAEPAVGDAMNAFRPVWAEIDLDAVRANVRALRTTSAPAELLAVVKADGYGHGAVPVARAALEGGAVALGVALVEEGIELRAAGIDAPILVLSEPVPEAAPSVVAYGFTPVVYTLAGIDALAKAVADHGDHNPLAVHLKVDTGMHRVGCRVEDAVDLAAQVVDRHELRLAGVCTHLAVADEADNAYTAEQLARFEGVLGALRARGIPTGTVHASNTAGAIDWPAARYDMVRVGIGVYGIAPADEFEGRVSLHPALSLKARVSHVKTVPKGARLSYGLRYETTSPARIATVPIGYADGVPRELAHRGGEAIVRGRRCPIAGTVTMDQLMLDVGDLPVEVGDEVVLIGRQGDEEVTAASWARAMGTIAYTIVCGIGPRVPRVYLSAGPSA